MRWVWLATAMFGASILAPPGARAQEQIGTVVAGAPANGDASFDIFLPLRHEAELDRLLADLHDPASPRYQRWLNPAEFAARFGIDDTTATRIEGVVRAAGMRVVGRTAQTVRVAARVEQVERLFAVSLRRVRFADGAQALAADRALSLPQVLAELGANVPQFSGVIAKRRHHAPAAAPQSQSGPLGAYYTADLRQAYDYPALPTASTPGLSGTGATIGILMQNDYQASDIAAYFTLQGLSTPSLTSIPINGGAPYDSSNSTETHLDIQQSAGMAPGASVVLYNVATLSDADLLAGLARINTDNVVDVVNMSFGGQEKPMTTTTLQSWSAQFKQGNAQGITFVASSGDNGSIPPSGLFSTTLTPEHPASDPNVTGVGGTNLVTAFDGTTNSAYVRENASDDKLVTAGVWGSGGGISTKFAKPSYQKLVTTQSTTKRTVPDVSLHMGGCPGSAKQPCGPDRSSDWVAINGGFGRVIGTSASAPDFAGLVALRRVLTGKRQGNVNTLLYNLASKQVAGGTVVYRHDIPGNNGTPGKNGNYTTVAPYDLVIGLGTIYGRAFLGASTLPAADVPGTPGNP